MSTLMIGYDLNRPGQNYSELIAHIKTLGTWWHHLDSTWLIVTSRTVAEVRDEIKRFIDPGDEVLVLNITGDSWASFGLSDSANNWLRKNV